jgi:DNA modification methylase
MTQQLELNLFDVPSIAEQFGQNHEITLYTGDALEFLRGLPEQTVQLIITSPPYNIGKEYETRRSIAQYLEEQALVIDELVRALRDGGSICWQVGNHVDDGEVFPLDIFFYDLFKQRGLQLRNRIIWHFRHGLHASKRFSGRYETILWFTKGSPYTFNLDPVRVPSKYPGKLHYKGPNIGKPSGNPLGKNPSDIWEFVAQEWDAELWDIPNVKSNHPEKTIHPCQYPIELVERCLLALTEEHDLVLDPYCGVGSALIAAMKHRRRAAGCDREPLYTEAVRERIVAFYEGRLKIRPIGRPVHTPTGRERVAQFPDAWQSKRL